MVPSSGPLSGGRLLAWNSTDQRPFFELDGIALAVPGAEIPGQLTEPGTHYVEGLNGTTGTSTHIGRFEVTE